MRLHASEPPAICLKVVGRSDSAVACQRGKVRPPRAKAAAAAAASSISHSGGPCRSVAARGLRRISRQRQPACSCLHGVKRCRSGDGFSMQAGGGGGAAGALPRWQPRDAVARAQLGGGVARRRLADARRQGKALPQRHPELLHPGVHSGLVAAGVLVVAQAQRQHQLSAQRLQPTEQLLGHHVELGVPCAAQQRGRAGLARPVARKARPAPPTHPLAARPRAPESPSPNTAADMLASDPGASDLRSRKRQSARKLSGASPCPVVATTKTTAGAAGSSATRDR